MKTKTQKTKKVEIKHESIKKLIYGQFLNTTQNNKPLPSAEEIRNFLLAKGIDKGNMAIVKIKSHYSFYKAKWNDVITYGKLLYMKK